MAHHPMAMQLPLATGLKANKGVELLTWGTPNGFKASIMLEELKGVYGTEFTVQPINLAKAIQKQSWYLELNPNGKIPTIMDHDTGIAVGESGAIVQYLARQHDPDNVFSFTEPADIAKSEMWIGFMQGDMTPTGNMNARFYRFLPVKHKFPIAMFHREAVRQFDTINKALEGREYLVGPGAGKYSLADIALWPFVNQSTFLGLGSLSQWPNLEAWWARIWARPAVKKGVDTPYPALTGIEAMERQVKESEEFAAKEKELQATLKQALEEVPAMPSGPPPSGGPPKP